MARTVRRRSSLSNWRQMPSLGQWRRRPSLSNSLRKWPPEMLSKNKTFQDSNAKHAKWQFEQEVTELTGGISFCSILSLFFVFQICVFTMYGVTERVTEVTTEGLVRFCVGNNLMPVPRFWGLPENERPANVART